MFCEENRGGWEPLEPKIMAGIEHCTANRPRKEFDRKDGPGRTERRYLRQGGKRRSSDAYCARISFQNSRYLSAMRVQDRDWTRVNAHFRNSS